MMSGLTTFSLAGTVSPYLNGAYLELSAHGFLDRLRVGDRVRHQAQKVAARRCSPRLSGSRRLADGSGRAPTQPLAR